MEILRVALFDLDSVLFLHVWKTDALNGVLCHHEEVLGPTGAAVVAALVVDIKEIVVAVNHTGKNGGMVSLLIKFLIWG